MRQTDGQTLWSLCIALHGKNLIWLTERMEYRLNQLHDSEPQTPISYPSLGLIVTMARCDRVYDTYVVLFCCTLASYDENKQCFQPMFIKVSTECVTDSRSANNNNQLVGDYYSSSSYAQEMCPILYFYCTLYSRTLMWDCQDFFRRTLRGICICQ